jgi:hypothetical protein
MCSHARKTHQTALDVPSRSQIIVHGSLQIVDNATTIAVVASQYRSNVSYIVVDGDATVTGGVIDVSLDYRPANGAVISLIAFNASASTAPPAFGDVLVTLTQPADVCVRVAARQMPTPTSISAALAVDTSACGDGGLSSNSSSLSVM